LKEKGKGGAVQWGKEKKWQVALLQIDCGEGSKDVAAVIGEEQITRLACRSGKEEEIRERRLLVGNCCWLWIGHN
jgi:hypothetical protein